MSNKIDSLKSHYKIIYRMSVYNEDNIQEFGVSNNWHNAKVIDSIKTHRGTTIEMVERPKWGLACYMDNSIQSALIDEKIYHEALVHPVMMSVQTNRKVMIIGGGEGATAREVLKWPGVEEVVMYEWDKDVVKLFKEKYPQWAQGAWNDPRLKIRNEDIFKAIKNPPGRLNKYDVIIIDLFEPCEENKQYWLTLIKSLHNWISINGSIVMYAGMRNILEKQQPYQKLMDMIEFMEIRPGHIVRDLCLSKEIIPYRVWIPSFSGESTFLLLKHYHLVPEFNFEEAKKLNSHISKEVWNSYKTLNW
jgi:predicted membrane-bound spermidine synthase